MTEAIESTRDRTLSENSDRSESGIDPHFEPIISLPEVKVITNEEDEDVMLKMRAKLYRFDTSSEDGSEWKERGTGEVKLLHHLENNTVRVVMRRDKTLKICANHFINPWMELKPSAGSDKAFVYTVLADFSDEKIKTECLAIKFSSAEFANTFKEKFNEAKNIIATKCKLYNDENDEDECCKPDSEDKENHKQEKNNLVEKICSSMNVSEEESKDEENHKQEENNLVERLCSLNVSKEESKDTISN